MSTRNIVILVAAVVAVAVLGFLGWNTFRGPIVNSPVDQSTNNGKLEGPARDQFIADSVGACVKQRPATIAEDKFKQYCTCASEKAADLITPDESKEINATNQIPDSLLNKLKDPMKQCLQSAGLLPAQ